MCCAPFTLINYTLHRINILSPIITGWCMGWPVHVNWRGLTSAPVKLWAAMTLGLSTKWPVSSRMWIIWAILTSRCNGAPSKQGYKMSKMWQVFWGEIGFGIDQAYYLRVKAHSKIKEEVFPTQIVEDLSSFFCLFAFF